MSTLFLGDCLDVMRNMDADSIDAIVTAPLALVAWSAFRYYHVKGCFVEVKREDA